MTGHDHDKLEARLDDFDPAVRRAALAALAGLHAGRLPAATGGVNMHCHSFFSYNARGWSPGHIAWEARKGGWHAAALCDFDVLDGLEEFLAAGRVLELRVAVHLETRAFVRELATSEINSPGEPGVTYIMGAGFSAVPSPPSPAAEGLASLRRSARERNEALVARINAALPAIAIDYEADVLPRTPAGAATERHIVAAYVDRAARRFPDPAERAAFWTPLLGTVAPADFAALERDRPALEERVRGALAKRGGVGYRPPDAATFPPLEDFIALVGSCAAMPMIPWLDGTSAGERDCERLLDLFTAKGCVALNIIPDRNCRGATAEETAIKTAKLDEVVAAAQRRALPLNIGTEMNRPGLPLIDDLSGPALRRHRRAFVNGAQVMVGHTLLAAYADMPYTGGRAAAEFPDRARRNAFFAAVGALPPLNTKLADRLAAAGPERARAIFADLLRHAPGNGAAD